MGKNGLKCSYKITILTHALCECRIWAACSEFRAETEDVLECVEENILP
jgi:hypothetical protein